MQFRLFNFPFRIESSFWIVCLVLGLVGQSRLGEALAFVAALVLCIVVHELGHAFFARWYGGRDVSITLHAMGGSTTWIPGRPNTWQEKLIISVSGPGLGFLPGLLAAPLIFTAAGKSLDPLALNFCRDLFYISVIWGLVNLVPLRPMDGFQALAALFGICRGTVPTQRLEWISILSGGALVVAALKFQLFFAAVLFGYFAWKSAGELQSSRP